MYAQYTYAFGNLDVSFRSVFNLVRYLHVIRFEAYRQIRYTLYAGDEDVFDFAYGRRGGGGGGGLTRLYNSDASILHEHRSVCTCTWQ